MARGPDPNRADTQWYIAETEAHNLDPETRNDEEYATFGVVRMGMSHVRAIALVPTTDDPTGEEIVMNPASTAGRPLYEVHISNIDMIGVVASPHGEGDDDDGGFGAIILAIGGGLFTISLWLWSFALIGGVVWAIREDALPIYDDKEIEEVVDALLD